jgi:hypothetical protein
VIAPLKIRVYSKDFEKKCDIRAPKFVTVIQRSVREGVGEATIGVLSTDPCVQKINVREGDRVQILDEYDQHVMSGRFTVKRVSGPAMAGLVEYDVIDDAVIVSETLGWVIPTAAITAQGTAGTNWTMTDNAETVLKTAMQLNAVDRLGRNLVIATDLGRGGVITANLRFDPISELYPVIDGSGLERSGINPIVYQSGDHLVLDVYEPASDARILTEEMGVVIDWKFTERATTATRAVIAGAGEGTLRLLRALVAGDGRETDVGYIIERYRDARDTDDPTLMYSRGQETLDEGAAKVSLSVTLAQTEHFRVGANGLRVGDPVTIYLSGVASVENEELSSATLSWTDDDGWKATPKIGDREDSVDAQLMRALERITRRLGREGRA